MLTHELHKTNGTPRVSKGKNYIYWAMTCSMGTHDSHEFHWDDNDIPWSYHGFHCKPRVPHVIVMGHHGIPIGTSRQCHGEPMILWVTNGNPWETNEIPWNYHGFPWETHGDLRRARFKTPNVFLRFLRRPDTTEVVPTVSRDCWRHFPDLADN